MKPFFILLFASFIFLSCKKDNPALPSGLVCADNTISWTTTVNPTIQASCASSGCHDGTAGQPDYRTYAGVKASVDDGKIRQRVIDTKDMPSSGTFSQAQRDSIQCWIEAGALQN